MRLKTIVFLNCRLWSRGDNVYLKRKGGVLLFRSTVDAKKMLPNQNLKIIKPFIYSELCYYTETKHCLLFLMARIEMHWLFFLFFSSSRTSS